MQSTIALYIKQEAAKLIKRHEIYASELAREFARRGKRSGHQQVKEVLTPSHWALDRGFNPYYVRGHADRIAHSIEASLSKGTYKPRPAYLYAVPKGDGTDRMVAIFQIADNALSLLTFTRLMEKNARHLSSHAYAYRKDLSLHDAILHIASDFSRRPRHFIAEFDFKQFFDKRVLKK